MHQTVKKPKNLRQQKSPEKGFIEDARRFARHKRGTDHKHRNEAIYKD